MGLTISVIIPLYNKAPYIERAINSVLGQTFQDFEIIVVNDGSTDGGEVKVHSLNDPRIKLINQENAGVSAARNRGCSASTADFVAFLDADDEWKPEFLETVWQLKSLYPQAKIYATLCQIQESNRKIDFAMKLPEHTTMQLQEFINNCIKYGSFLFMSAILVYKPSLERINGFPIGIPRGEDLDVFYKMIENSSLAFCNRVLAVYRRDAENRICNTHLDVYESPLIRTLKVGLENHIYSPIQEKYINDYVCWREIIPVHRLIRQGKRNEARKHIYEAWRSPMKRRDCIKYFLQSFIPLKMLDSYSIIKYRLLGNKKDIC